MHTNELMRKVLCGTASCQNISRDLSVNSAVDAQNIKHAMQIHEDLSVLAKIHEELSILATSLLELKSVAVRLMLTHRQ